MPELTLSQTSNKWRTYIYWFFWISVAFFTVYPLCNWFTSGRETVLNLYIAPELRIPFVPEFVWVYLSLYALFLIPPFALSQPRLNILGRQLIAATIFCGLIFLILPAQLGFERAVPEDPFYSSLFANLFSVDLPHNMVPSLHVTFSALILFAILGCTQSMMARAVFGGWLVLICISTILVHQHHLLDVAAGLLMAATINHATAKGEHHV